MADDLRLNGIKIEDRPQEIMANALSLFHEQITYMSKEALMDLLYGLNDLVIQHLEYQGKSAKKYKNAKEAIKQFNETKSRDNVMKTVYNEYLRLNGLGLLPGFGFSNKFGDVLKGNAEYQPIKRS